MRVVLFGLLVLVACSNAHEADQFRSVRQQRSVIALSNYLHDVQTGLRDDDLEFKARGLIDRHYEYALSRLDPKEGFKRALLTHLRSDGGPEIIVYIDSPTRKGEGPWSVHFGSERSYSSAFSSSATRAASKVFQHELMEFRSADDVDSSKQTKLEVHVQWQVGASELFFDSFLALGRLPGEGSTIQGIEAVAQFRFQIPGQPEPFLLSASAAPTEFEYMRFGGLPSVSGLYAGMLDSAFEGLMEQILLR